MEKENEGEPANPGSPGKMAVKTECVFYDSAHSVYIFAMTIPT